MHNIKFSNLPEVYFSHSICETKTRKIIADTETRLIIAEAARKNIDSRTIPNSDIVEMKFAHRRELLRMHKPSTNRGPAERICLSKNLTDAILRDQNIPVPKGFAVFESFSDDEISQMFADLQKPVVVKPANGTQGIGVYTGITDSQTAIKYVRKNLIEVEANSLINTGCVIMEEMKFGREYRIICTAEKVLAVMYRDPASVIGNGKNTIYELIEQKNNEAIRNLSQDLYPHIRIDEDMRKNLLEQQLDTQSVPPVDMKVVLRKISNIMAGGDAYDCTDDIHPSVAQIATAAVRAIPGLTFCGIDFMTSDISQEQTDESCSIIEINSAPEFAMHDIPMFGKPRGITQYIVKSMFPEAYES